MYTFIHTFSGWSDKCELGDGWLKQNNAVDKVNCFLTRQRFFFSEQNNAVDKATILKSQRFNTFTIEYRVIESQYMYVYICIYIYNTELHREREREIERERET
jgi:hypothetical protein